MNAVLEKVLNDKRETRKRLAALPFTEKIAMLEQLRDRSRLIAAHRLRQSTRPARAGFLRER